MKTTTSNELGGTLLDDCVQLFVEDTWGWQKGDTTR